VKLSFVKTKRKKSSQVSEKIFFFFISHFSISNKFHKFSYSCFFLSAKQLNCLTRQATDFTRLCIAAVNVRAVITCPIAYISSSRRSIVITPESMKKMTKKMKKIIIKFRIQLLTHFRYERQ
jgi:hypothetical protein